jgi:WD40 repeat protein
VKSVAHLSGHSGAIYGLTQGNSVNTVFTGAVDGMIAEWNLESFTPENFSVKIGKPIYSLTHIFELGLLIAGLSDGSFHVIDLNAKKEIHHIIFHKGPIFSIEYSIINNHFCISSGDGSISIWNLSDFKLKLHLPFCTEKIRMMSIFPG